MCFSIIWQFLTVIEYAYNYITVVLNQSNQEFLNDVHLIIFKKKVVLFEFLVRNIIMTGLMDEIAFYFYFPLTWNSLSSNIKRTVLKVLFSSMFWK